MKTRRSSTPIGACGISRTRSRTNAPNTRVHVAHAHAGAHPRSFRTARRSDSGGSQNRPQRRESARPPRQGVSKRDPMDRFLVPGPSELRAADLRQVDKLEKLFVLTERLTTRRTKFTQLCAVVRNVAVAPRYPPGQACRPPCSRAGGSTHRSPGHPHSASGPEWQQPAKPNKQGILTSTPS